MNKLKDKELTLLVLAVILLTIKFLILPIVEWQDEKILSISMKQKQLSKAESLVLAENELTSLHEKIAEQFTRINAKIPSIKLDDFKISTQRGVVALISELNLKVDRTSWVEEPKKDDILTVRLELRINGKMSDFLLLHNSIVNRYPNAVINDIRLDITRHVEKNLGKLKGRISLEFLVRDENVNT